MGKYKRIIWSIVFLSMLVLLSTPLVAMALSGYEVTSGLSSGYGVSYPCQRQTFYTNSTVSGNDTHWVWYVNSTSNQTGYRSSTDDGSTWSSFSDIGDCPDQNDFGVWYDGSIVHYVRTNSTATNNTVYYGRGTPQVNGTISWAAETVVKSGIVNVTWIEPCVAVNSTGDIMVGCVNTTLGVLESQVVTEVSLNNGTSWISPAYPSIGNANTTHPSISPLSNDRFYLTCAYTNTTGYVQPRGFLWNGTGYGSAEFVDGLDPLQVGSWYSAVAIGTEVYMVWSTDDGAANYTIYFSHRTYATGNSSWTSHLDDLIDDEYVPALSVHYDDEDLIMTLVNNASGPISFMTYDVSAGSWSSLATKVSDASAHTTSGISAAYRSYSPIGFVWLDGAGPYNLNYGYYDTPTPTPTPTPTSDAGAAGELAQLMPLIFAAIVILALVGALVAVTTGADLVLTFIMAAVGAVIGVAMISVISGIVSDL